MVGFKSWRSFRDFERVIRKELRFVWPREVEEFLQAVLTTAQSRRVVLKEGFIAWRARLGHDWRPEGEGEDTFEVPSAYPPAGMKPLLDRAYDGRANPKGIPCLYLSTKEKTAVSEVRPWIGSYVSVGQFTLMKSVEIIDCSRYHSNTVFYFEEPSPEKIERAVWSDIDRAFSEPMTRADDSADYVSTQIIAELFKRAGFGGVAYKSKFGEAGFNIALFDIGAADLMNCNLCRIDKIEFDFSQQDNPYFVSKHYPKVVTEGAEKAPQDTPKPRD